MKKEDLFLAIGEVEGSRLLRSELTVNKPSGASQTEEMNMTRKTKRTIRNLLIAAVVVSMLGITVFAVGGFVIFDSPDEMLAAIFGNETGYDHSDGSITKDPWGGPEGILVEPTFDRVPADETVVAEDIAPYVEVVGQSISHNGYTLTVDAFMFDSATGCGFFTYLLENPQGVSGYSLQADGSIWYEGRPDIVSVNQYGYPYIIQEKTTETCLAVTYYFRWDARRGNNLEICFQSQERYTTEEFYAMLEPVVAELKQQMTPEEIVQVTRDRLGEDIFARAMEGLTEAEIIEQCYLEAAAIQEAQRIENEGKSEVISVPCNLDQQLENVTLYDGDILITPISVHMDITNMDFLHTDHAGNYVIDTGNLDSMIIRYKDGTEYTVFADYLQNYVFSLTQTPEENVTTEIYVSPEEDPMGEGFVYVKNSHGYCLLTMMFNRIIDIEEISAVVLNGVEIPVD